MYVYEDGGVKVTVDAQQVQPHMASVLPSFNVYKKHALCAGHDGIGGGTNKCLNECAGNNTVAKPDLHFFFKPALIYVC